MSFEWRRLRQLTLVLGGLAAAGDRLLPTHGAVGLLARAAVLLATVPALFLTGFAHEQELVQVRRLARASTEGLAGGSA